MTRKIYVDTGKMEEMVKDYMNKNPGSTKYNAIFNIFGIRHSVYYRILREGYLIDANKGKMVIRSIQRRGLLHKILSEQPTNGDDN